ncbi:MAG: nicotinamide-nucleotide amidohydrolase family protein [Bacteriovoracaceae bacterium]
MPSVALICIGDELLNGHTHDKNAFWLGKFLPELGLKLSQVLVIPDSVDGIAQTIEKALKQFDVVITSGGIGPTQDDLTRLAFSKAFDASIEKNQRVTQIVKDQYERRGINWDEYKKTLKLKNPYQDYECLPEGFTPLSNDVGLAPPFYKIIKTKFVLGLPGVPREFQSIIEKNLKNLFMQAGHSLDQNQSRIVIRTRETPEEKIFFKIAPKLWDRLSKFGKVASLPHIMGVDIVLSGLQGPTDEVHKRIEDIIHDENLNSIVWQIGEVPLPNFVIAKAKEKNLTLSTAESCTGGLIANLITDVPGASEVYLGTVVSYANEAKMKLLNVSKQNLDQFGAVSTQVAEEMALGASLKLGSNLSVSTTGIAGPAGGSPHKPVGTVAIAGVRNGNVSSSLYHYKGTRDQLKYRFCKKALFTFLDLIQEKPKS